VRFLRIMLTALVVAAVAATLSGCGSSGVLPALASPSPTATSLKIAKVVDHKWGFEMAYPYGWVGTHYEKPTPGGVAGTLQYVVAYADPNGSMGNDAYLDSVQVAVYRLAGARRPEDLTPQLASRLALGVMLKDMPSLSPRGVKKIDVFGVPGCMVSYQYDAGGVSVDANSILILRGRRAYWATGQSGAYTWRTVSPTLATCQNAFKLL